MFLKYLIGYYQRIRGFLLVYKRYHALQWTIIYKLADHYQVLNEPL